MKGSFEIIESGNLFIFKNRFLFILDREEEGGREEERRNIALNQAVMDQRPAPLPTPTEHRDYLRHL